MAKKIKIMGGYEVQFDQRSAGEETPYWIGRIYNNGIHVGGFENNGRGGGTLVHPPSVVKDFVKMVDDSASKIGFDSSSQYERENEVLVFAESYGYSRRKFSVTVEELWNDWIVQYHKLLQDNGLAH